MPAHSGRHHRNHAHDIRHPFSSRTVSLVILVAAVASFYLSYFDSSQFDINYEQQGQEDDLRHSSAGPLSVSLPSGQTELEAPRPRHNNAVDAAVSDKKQKAADVPVLDSTPAKHKDAPQQEELERPPAGAAGAAAAAPPPQSPLNQEPVDKQQQQPQQPQQVPALPTAVPLLTNEEAQTRLPDQQNLSQPVDTSPTATSEPKL